jgi:cobalt-precorrin-5B (C1)-methyltransferase
VLGTTGIVVPYSCSAWIDSIHRGIDVARGMGIAHIAGSTGSMPARPRCSGCMGWTRSGAHRDGRFRRRHAEIPARHPVPRVTIAGGVAKMTKLAQGRLDLHSKRGTADMAALARARRHAGARRRNTTPKPFRTRRAGAGLWRA